MSNKAADTADIEEMIKTTIGASWEQAEPIGEGTEYRAEFDNGEHASHLAHGSCGNLGHVRHHARPHC
jgi:hypothetical protein